MEMALAYVILYQSHVSALATPNGLKRISTELSLGFLIA